MVYENGTSLADLVYLFPFTKHTVNMRLQKSDMPLELSDIDEMSGRNDIKLTRVLLSLTTDIASLLSVSHAIASPGEKQEIIRTIKESLQTFLRFSDIAILQYNLKKGVYRVFLEDCEKARQHEDFEMMASGEYPLEDGLHNVLMQSATAVLFTVPELRKHGGIQFDFLHAAGIAEVAGIRLMHNNEVFAGMALLSEKPDSFSQEDLRQIERFSHHLSGSLANILANEAIRQREKEKLEEEKLYLQEEISNGYTDIIGAGPEMQHVFYMLSQVSRARSTVLILGETGTGKELIARAIHNASLRRNKLMVKVNCAALPPDLIESELFGHERGSFTGAVERRIGKFELANHGTLFLDEIGELPPGLQVKLLRAIQEKEIERIGGKHTIETDVRIIAATNRNLQKEVAEGRFRSDLFYRLNVFPIMVPPLRDRKEDIPLLAAHFIDRFTRTAGKKNVRLSSTAMKQLEAYNWPGNVRELEHVLERSILLTQGNIIREIHLSSPLSKPENKGKADEDYSRTLAEVEREYILGVLNKCRGKVFGPGGAAEILGLHVSTLNHRIRKLGIHKEHKYL